LDCYFDLRTALQSDNATVSILQMVRNANLPIEVFRTFEDNLYCVGGAVPERGNGFVHPSPQRHGGPINGRLNFLVTV
jgi:hypothetical protein